VAITINVAAQDLAGDAIVGTLPAGTLKIYSSASAPANAKAAEGTAIAEGTTAAFGGHAGNSGAAMSATSELVGLAAAGGGTNAHHFRFVGSGGVIVQGNAHGTDNSVVLDALKREPKRLRAAAIVKPDTGREELKRMADLGVRALRFHHMPHGVGFSPLGMQSFEKLAPLMADLGLHAQFMMDANALDSAMPFFKDWKLPIVLDHMGNVDGTKGPDQPGVRQMCRLLAEGRIWVKLSGTYRVSTQYPDYPDANAIHEALVNANPEQVVWGTDWPHPRLEKDMPEDGHLLDLFNAWTPDADLRKKILVDNPARLYGFK
jgi:predicted TIM-barrel fold metal-dependent hydrolase